MSRTTGESPTAELEAAAEALRSVEAEIDDVGADRVQRLADVHGRFSDLLSRYREPASGSGRQTFESYVEFQGKLEEFVEELPEDLLHRDAFEAAEDRLDRRRLEERDFDLARGDLEPVRRVTDLVEEREAARRRCREARHAVEARIRELEASIDDREAILAFDDVDLDAPVGTLREPIDAYESAVEDAFRDFRSSSGAVAVLDFVEATDAYPLVEFPPVPAELREYLAGHPAGTEPIPKLLEWADYTRSKLSHYVDDPASFRATVAGNRTYLARLDAEPLHVGWPPPPAETLRFRARELVAVVERFAPEPVVERLHAVRRLTRREDYARLRRAAVAREALDEAARRRLQDGSIHEELESLREERDRLARTLSEQPSP